MNRRVPGVIWTSDEDELLIDFVKNNECLYNIKNKYYRKSQMKQNLWNRIGNALEKSGHECFKRWSYVRDYYIRRKGKHFTGSGGETSKKRAELLSFLDRKASSQRSSVTNGVDDFQESQITEQTLVDIEENTSHIDNTENMIIFNLNEDDDNREKKKRKRSNSEERLQRNGTPAQSELDETDLFFNSMAKIVKQLPRYEQIQLRMQISSLVGNAELRSISKESMPTNDTSMTQETSHDQQNLYYVSDTSMTNLNEQESNEIIKIEITEDEL